MIVAQICYSTAIATLFIQFVLGYKLVIPREPTAREVAACKVTRDEHLQAAPTWPERLDFMIKWVQGLMESDPVSRNYVVQHFHLNNTEDELAKKVFAMYTRRWNDFLNRISDNERGHDGTEFAKKWQADGRIVDLDQPNWFKGSLAPYTALMEKLLPTFHKDEFITCVKLLENYVVD